MNVEAQRAAYLVGSRRSRQSRTRGAQHLVGWRMEIPEAQADGYSAVAEALVAEAVGGRWLSAETDAPDNPDDGDVIGPDGTRYSVRWTPRETGGLVLRPKDRDHLVAVLVVGVPPGQRIIGAIETTAGKTDRFWRVDWDPPAWLVPRRELRPL